MTWLDWLIVAVFAFSVLTAAWKGFFVEVFSLVGLVAGVAIAGLYYGQVAQWLTALITFPPARGAAAFLLIAVGIMVLAGILGRLVRWALRRIGLGWADRLAGAAFGLVKGCILVTLIVMALLAFFPQRLWLRQSQFASYFVGLARGSATWMPDDFGQKVRRGAGALYGSRPPQSAVE